jgi:hypothetical protein
MVEISQNLVKYSKWDLTKRWYFCRRCGSEGDGDGTVVVMMIFMQEVMGQWQQKSSW